LVFFTGAINADANHGIRARRIGLNMNVGSAAFVGIDNHLVGQAYNRRVVFANASDAVVLVLDMQRVVTQLPQDVLDRAQVGLAPGGTGEVLQDVFAQADQPAQRRTA